MSYTCTPSQIRLPDLFEACPLKTSANPYYEEAAAESRAWITKFNVFNDRKRAFIFSCESELLCAYSYPLVGYEQFRVACDFVNLLFVVDEVSDEQTGDGARETGQTFVNAMQKSDWNDGSTLAKIITEFKEPFLRFAGPRMVQRWNRLCEMYTDCVATEAELRELDVFVDLETFIPIRRYNSATPLCVSLVELTLGIDLEDEVYENPDFAAAYWAVCDHVWWSNDLYSYDLEQSRGQTGNNVVTILAKEKGLTLQESADLVGAKCNEFVNTYLDAKSNLSPSLGSDAARFIEAIGYWIIGNLMWSFESSRYFGNHRDQVRETGIVTLRPCEIPNYHSSDSSDEE